MDQTLTRHRNGRSRLFRGLGWLAVAGMLGLALVGPAAGTAAANDMHQAGPWGPPSYGGFSPVCDGPFANLDPNTQTGWHFVQTRVDDSATPPPWTLTAYFGTSSPGSLSTYVSTYITGGTVHWWIVTSSAVTLYSFSTDFTSPGQLNLSHVCYGTTTTTTSTSTTDTTDTTSTSTTATTSTTSTTTTPTTTTTTSRFTTSTESTPSFSTSTQSTSSQSTTTTPTTTTQSTTTEPTTSTANTGGVAGVTSAPTTTPPPTSTGGPTGTPNDGTWRIALIAMAGLLATILVMTPATARRRR